MIGEGRGWHVLVRNGDTTPWFFADAPTEDEGSIWLPAMYAAAEAMATELHLAEDAISQLVHAAAEAMAKCTRETTPDEEQDRAVAAASRALKALSTE